VHVLFSATHDSPTCVSQVVTVGFQSTPGCASPDIACGVYAAVSPPPPPFRRQATSAGHESRGGTLNAEGSKSFSSSPSRPFSPQFFTVCTETLLSAEYISCPLQTFSSTSLSAWQPPVGQLGTLEERMLALYFRRWTRGILSNDTVWQARDRGKPH
jgi:hypothetical protein